MRKDTLTLLGCSSSVALLLLTAAPATAESATGTEAVREIDFLAPAALAEADTWGNLAVEGGDCSCAQADGDVEGNLAINQFGCDCAGCRYVVRQMIAQGELTLVNQ